MVERGCSRGEGTCFFFKGKAPVSWPGVIIWTHSVRCGFRVFLFRAVDGAR